MDPAHFIKRDIKSGSDSNFLKDIWQPLEINSQATRVYREYNHPNRNQRYNFVNDFIHHRSYLSTQLSSDQIQGIHRDNAQRATKKGGFDQRTLFSPTKAVTEHVEWTPDVLVTDSLLDRFHIMQDIRERRLKDFYIQSITFFHYLTYKLGNEKIVKVRRKSLRAKMSYSFCIGSNQVRIFPRGSRSEGFNMQGSDTDILMEIDSAYEDGEEKIDGIFLRYDSMSGSLGYVTVEDIWGNTLSSDMFKTMFSGILSLVKFFMSTVIHGPSLSMTNSGDDIDMVPCIKCVKFPNIAHEWVHRKRKYGWPSQEMINSLVKQGCHIVPVGNKKIHIDEVEWRLSFSFAEQELVKSFNHTQFLVYGLLKIILKDILNQNTSTAELLCSHFMKTVMFWVIEETPIAIWSSRYLILCFHLCLERLIQFVIDENCPNYFVHVNNMFAERFTAPNSKNILLQVLCEISLNGIKWTSFSMPDLNSYFEDPTKVNDLKMKCCKKFETEMCEITLDLARVGKIAPLAFGKWLSLTEIYLQQAKSFYKNAIIRDNAAPQICHFLEISNTNACNKKAYVFHSIFMQLLLNGCKEDLMSGKALLASWLYKQGKYEDSMKVIGHALECSNLRIFQVGFGTIQNVCPDDSLGDIGSLWLTKCYNNLRYSSTFPVCMPFHSVLMPNELAWLLSFSLPAIQEIGTSTPALSIHPPDTYCYFLMCLIYLKEGKTEQFKEVYERMKLLKCVGSDTEDFFNAVSCFILRMVLETMKTRITCNFEEDIMHCDINTERLSSISAEMLTGGRSIFDWLSHNWTRMGLRREMLLKLFAILTQNNLQSLE